MKHKILNQHDERTIALIFDPGDEVISLLTRFVTDYNVNAARFTAIGAFSEARLGYFDLDRKRYEKIEVPSQVEVLSLIGDVAREGDKRTVHAHAVVGRRDGSTQGGHLLSATVRPTLEVLLVESPGYLARRFDPRFGIALIDVAE
jgi:uncharacterized protein